MAIVATNLATSSSTTDGTSYATASITPGANSLILAAFYCTVTTSPTPTITVSGNGLTWVQIDTTVAAARTIMMFRAMGASPTTGAVTFSGGATTLTTGMWSIVQFDGTDTSGTNGSGAIVQSKNSGPAAATSASVAFTATPAAGNGGFAAVGIVANEAVTPGSGWTIAGTTQGQATPVAGFIGEYATSACPANISATWTSSVASKVVGVEILAGAAATTTKQTNYDMQNRARFRASLW